MTEQGKPRSVSMNREGHTEHHRLSDGTQVDVRVDWTLDDARSGLVDEWAETHDLIDLRRTIRDADGKTIAVLLSAEAYEEGQNAIWRINEDSYGQVDSKYTPFQHHPSGSVERLIDTERLEKVITNIAHGKDAELSKEERDRIHYGALVAAFEFSFEPDSRGLVPVMTPGRATDGQHTEYYWSFLYPTPVAGLFLRPDDHMIGATEYTLTTGSGYAVVRGFWERDHADALAVKLAEALPGINWFTARNGDDLTTDIKKTMIAIIREHGLWRAEESA